MNYIRNIVYMVCVYIMGIIWKKMVFERLISTEFSSLNRGERKKATTKANVYDLTGRARRFYSEMCIGMLSSTEVGENIQDLSQKEPSITRCIDQD